MSAGKEQLWGWCIKCDKDKPFWIADFPMTLVGMSKCMDQALCPHCGADSKHIRPCSRPAQWISTSDRMPDDGFKLCKIKSEAGTTFEAEGISLALWLPGDNEWIGLNGDPLVKTDVDFWLDHVPPIPAQGEL